MNRTRREVFNYEWQMTRDEAERALCPRCGAEPGEHCINTFGEELKAPAHFQRLNAARELEAS